MSVNSRTARSVRYSSSPEVAHKFDKGIDAEVLFFTATGSGAYTDPHKWEVTLIAKDLVTDETAVRIATRKVETVIDYEIAPVLFEVTLAKMAHPVASATLDKGIVYRVNLTSRIL